MRQFEPLFTEKIERKILKKEDRKKHTKKQIIIKINKIWKKEKKKIFLKIILDQVACQHSQDQNAQKIYKNASFNWTIKYTTFFFLWKDLFQTEKYTNKRWSA